MTLLEILVKELPKRGGWPSENIHALVQGRTGNIYRAGGGSSLLGFALADDWELAEVTREQYEAALVASKKPEWDGDYPIPAGTEVEVHFEGDDSRVWTRFRVEYMAGEIVVLHDYRIDNVDAYKHKTLSFRPIRSEADRKRDLAVSAMADICRNSASNAHSAELIYDVIATGGMPGIRIE
ncbi:hypothetical protein [Cedecea sp. P7760]|uniref:hypothetical protein n=1 Tax=Cedecea sp. P7760 TaxID=2726983 RepID=UPI0015A29E2C|nr:hypothetical protein [Cedecea sp. P7760]NWC63691.1 hypothetical protein [Cedecea sp. P7760]